MSDVAPSAARVTLDGIQTVRTIEVARATVLDALAQNQDVRIDCGAVDSVDLSLIQLLLAAQLSARQTGKRLVIAIPAGGALAAALEQGGFLSPAGTNPFRSDDK